MATPTEIRRPHRRPPATADEKLYNAIHATRNLVVPFEPSGKGSQSVRGLEDLVDGLEDNLGINVGVPGLEDNRVLAVVPNRFEGTNDQKAMLETIEQKGYDMPVVFRLRSSLLEGCWRKQCSAFRYVEEFRAREREHELDTLEKFEELASHLRGTIEVKA